MVILDFMCIGSVELWGTGNEQKIQNENVLSQGIEPSTPHLPTGRLRPLGHRDRCFVVLKTLWKWHHQDARVPRCQNVHGFCGIGLTADCRHSNGCKLNPISSRYLSKAKRNSYSLCSSLCNRTLHVQCSKICINHLYKWVSSCLVTQLHHPFWLQLVLALSGHRLQFLTTLFRQGSLTKVHYLNAHMVHNVTSNEIRFKMVYTSK